MQLEGRGHHGQVLNTPHTAVDGTVQVVQLDLSGQVQAAVEVDVEVQGNVEVGLGDRDLVVGTDVKGADL